MNTTSWMTLASAGLLAVGALTLPVAKASEWNQKTIFTFNGPVEVPGQVLPAGTYVFKLADSQSDRNVVEVYNKDENHLYGTFLAVPDYHLKTPSKPIITFEERAAGSPEAIKAWFWPGDNFGHEFVYPKAKATELAKANNQPVPSMPNEMAANTTKPTKNMNEPHVMAMKKAPLKAVKPNQEEVDITEVFVPPPPRQNPAPQTEAKNNMPNNSGMQNNSNTSTQERLPRTGSSLPLVGLIGLLSLGAAGSLGLVTTKAKAGK